MKFIHLGDLHLGKKVNDFSMIEDQKVILIKILNIIDSEKPDAVLIAGDVYDKAFPSVEAVDLLDDFLNDLAQRKTETFIISGNHDSAERLAFASKLIDMAGIHISQAYNGETAPYELRDEYGAVKVYLLPFVKPVHVRKALDDESVVSYTDALAAAVKSMNVDTGERNLLVTHQFVTGAETCDSEDISVGGTNNVDAVVFDCFDYVALGHLHSPQKVSRETVRYSGSPLKYSFSEVRQKKSVTVVEMAEKGSVAVRTIPLEPKYDMVELRGDYDTLMSKANYDSLNLEDYYRIILTDEEDIPDAITRLRTVYHKIMRLEYDNTRTRTRSVIDNSSGDEKRTPIDFINELYEKQNGKPLDDNQREFALNLIENIWRDEE